VGLLTYLEIQENSKEIKIFNNGSSFHIMGKWVPIKTYEHMVRG